LLELGQRFGPVLLFDESFTKMKIKSNPFQNGC
jgi:hypothetical protein